MFQFFLSSTGVSSVSVDTADVVVDVVDPAASGTGAASQVVDVATVTGSGQDAAISLGPVSVIPDVATVVIGVSDATPNELAVFAEEAVVMVIVEDPVARVWPTIGQRQSLTTDVLYERQHVGETRIRRQSPDDAPRPLRPQEAV